MLLAVVGFAAPVSHLVAEPALPDGLVTLDNPKAPRLEIGNSRQDALAILGAPDRRLTTDVWIIWNYTVEQPEVATRSYASLIVTFKNDRVSAIRLASRPALEALVARLDARRLAAAAAPVPAPN
jgi:hypothetical protein